jgi:hypothetical protein
MSDTDKLAAREAERSGPRSLLRERAASGQKAARDSDLVGAAATEQQLAHGRDISAVEAEISRIGRQQQGSIG